MIHGNDPKSVSKASLVSVSAYEGTWQAIPNRAMLSVGGTQHVYPCVIFQSRASPLTLPAFFICHVPLLVLGHRRGEQQQVSTV